jgi:hypothetical protein
MQSSTKSDEQIEDKGAGESSLAAANAASSQADAMGDITPGQTPEGESTGAGQSTMADSDTVTSPS